MTGYVIVQHQRMFEVIQIENEVSIIAKRKGRQISFPWETFAAKDASTKEMFVLHHCIMICQMTFPLYEVLATLSVP